MKHIQHHTAQSEPELVKAPKAALPAALLPRHPDCREISALEFMPRKGVSMQHQQLCEVLARPPREGTANEMPGCVTTPRLSGLESGAVP